MKKFNLRLAMVLCTLFCCTACFDLQENLFLKKDGSGNFSFIVDMSQAKAMLSMFGGEGNNIKFSDNTDTTSYKKEGQSTHDNLGPTFAKTRQKLLATEGISNVKTIEDTIKFTFGLSFDFQNISALNKAMNNLFNDDDTTKTAKKDITYFEYKDNKLTRINILDSKSILGKSSSMAGKSTDLNSENPLFNIEQLFSTVSYTTNYKFEEKIMASANNNAILSEDKNNITLKIYPFANSKDTTKTKATIGNTITLK